MLGQVVVQIAEDDPGLVLGGVDAGLLPQALRMKGAAANLDLHPDEAPFIGGREVDIVHREAELIETADPFPDPIALVTRDHELLGQLVP